MKIPIEIDHVFLRDAIIEIRYASNVEFEIIAGFVFEELRKIGYSLEIVRPQIPMDSGLQITGEPVFSDINTTVKFNPNSLVFNIKGYYLFWKNYFPKVKNVLHALYKLNVINSINRVGIRYINVFEGIDIFKIIKDDLRLTISKYKVSNTHIKTEILLDNFKIILNIGNGFLLQKEKKIGSIFDIDVIRDLQYNVSNEELLKIIDQAHAFEKRVFFENLNEDYLKSLNPVY